MLKKLKRNFVLNNMFLLGIAVIAIFTAFCLLIYLGEERKLTNVLDDNITVFQERLPHFPTSAIQPEDIVYDHFFTVLVDHDGNIVSATEATLNHRSVEKAVNIALSSEHDRGNATPFSLSYKKASVKEGTLISFVSREHLNERVQETAGHSIFAGFVSLLIYFIISNILADIAIAPVQAAWDQQRQFLADASHDLKTPLTVILANNNILASHKEQTVQSQMKWIESTSEEAGRMSDLVNKMLELAKGEAAKEEIKLGEIDLSETAENSILQFEVVAFEKNVTIESNVEPNIFTKTHRATFSKVLEILFDNAIKYSDEGGKIKVALYQTSKKIYFTINNKGEYIKPDELPYIFERFYRTNKERKVGGHGLGLSIAKKKCDLMGAKLLVQSSEEDGTTFTIVMKSHRKK